MYSSLRFVSYGPCNQTETLSPYSLRLINIFKKEIIDPEPRIFDPSHGIFGAKNYVSVYAQPNCRAANSHKSHSRHTQLPNPKAGFRVRKTKEITQTSTSFILIILLNKIFHKFSNSQRNHSITPLS